ncbi:flagellar brake protein [Gorillibacterium timonense]|uniref:flagellar brake protein n=1 Tax=Gorillibacterium timonense TaxID=1689269 RepID=UPI000A6336AC|nr:flagellar brake domain-containing protein [Gorillibacterium timonense]
MLPSINQLLYMQVNSIDEAEASQEYKARIADIGEEQIAIEIPLNEKTGKLKRLVQGDELSAYFVTADGYKHYFTTEVTGFSEDGIRLVLLRKPTQEEITKVQRRSFLRVAADLEISVKLPTGRFYVGRTDDVGGGGVSFYSDKDTVFEPDQEVSCWLLVPQRGKIDHVRFTGEVIRENMMETRKICMLRYKLISDKDRQKIIRFCFERQIESRKY